MKIHITFFWVMTLCSDVVGNHFREQNCLHLQGIDRGTTKKTLTWQKIDYL